MTDLEKKIRALLEKDLLSQDKKDVLDILLPVMSDAEMKEVLATLEEADKKMSALDEKEKRVYLKYEIMLNKVGGKK